MKAPRSRQEATSGAVPLSKAVASSAQRASWKEWRRLSGGAGRLAAARTAPRSGPSARRASAATSIGSRSAASTTAQSSSRPPVACGATTAGQASAASARSSAAGRVGGVVEVEDEHRRLVADPERLQPAAQLGRLHAPAERAGEDVAGEPPLGLAGDPAAHQLERDDRDRLLQDQPLEVAEPAGVADDHDPGLRRPAAGRDHRVGQRPAGDRGVRGDEGVAVGGVAERLFADRRRSRRRRAGGGSRGRRAARRGRRGSRRCRRPRRRSSRRFPPGRAPRGPAARAAAARRSPAAAPRTAR